jgi:hypothetical protein
VISVDNEGNVTVELNDFQVSARVTEAAERADELGLTGAAGVLDGLCVAMLVEPKLVEVVRVIIEGSDG